jgi:hypothetical protein
MRMLQARGKLDLAVESLDVHARDELGRQDFDDDVAAQCFVADDEHARHAATAQLSLDGIGGTERCFELLANVHHACVGGMND